MKKKLDGETTLKESKEKRLEKSGSARGTSEKGANTGGTCLK